jgi:Tol biopolymer transport system component
MDSEKLRRAEELYQAALDLESSSREELLADADSELRAEVEARLNRAAETKPAPGALIGPYRLESRIGAGGMGEVWKASDTRLGRAVAIKFASGPFSDRFQREARAIASLNHPHICTLHDIGPSYLVMEYIEGLPLTGPLPLAGALEYAGQILDALDAAHRQGIIHRDVKPANILVTPHGIKLLDFGLAKRNRSRWAATKASAAGVTQKGVLIGTPQYMSPEQVQDGDVDARTDIFGFGCVFYEMITGRCAFTGSNAASVMAAILERPAPSIAEFAPPALDQVLRKCLEKDPKQRWQTALDLKAALAISGEHPPATAPAPPDRKWMWAGALVVALAALATFLPRYVHPRNGAAGPRTPVTITALTAQGEPEFQPAISPDGKSIAFVREGAGANYDIYVKPLADEARRLTTSPDNDLYPAWSADGRNIAFLRATPESSRLMVIPAAGGDEKEITVVGRFDAGHTRGIAGPLLRLPNPGPAWSADSSELAYRQCVNGERSLGCPLYAISLATSKIRRLTEQSNTDISDFCPAFSPDGKWIAFARFTAFAAGDVYLMPSSGGAARRLTNESNDIRGVAWTQDSAGVVFSSNRSGAFSLWRVGLRDSAITPVYSTGSSTLEPALSKDGSLLVYTDATLNVGVWQFDIAQKTTQKLIRSPRQNQNATWSPDGKSIAFTSNRLGSWEVWRVKADGEQPAQLTNLHAIVMGTIRWSPDGKRLVVETQMQGHYTMLIVPAEGGGQPAVLKTNIAEPRVLSWSRDGRWIYFRSTGGGNPRVWKAPAEGGDAQMVVDWRATSMAESPDGGTLYLSSTDLEGIRQFKLPAGPLRFVPGLEQARPQRWWTVGPASLYLYDAPGGAPGLFSYSFARENVTRLSTLGRDLPLATESFAASPDGRYLIYSRIDSASSNLMAVRGSFLEP